MERLNTLLESFESGGHLVQDELKDSKTSFYSSRELNEAKKYKQEALTCEKRLTLRRKEKHAALIQQLNEIDRKIQERKKSSEYYCYKRKDTDNEPTPTSKQEVNSRDTDKSTKVTVEQIGSYLGHHENERHLRMSFTDENRNNISITVGDICRQEEHTKTFDNKSGTVGIPEEIYENLSAVEALQQQQQQLESWYEKMQEQLQREQMKLSQKFDEMKLEILRQKQHYLETSQEYIQSMSPGTENRQDNIGDEMLARHVRSNQVSEVTVSTDKPQSCRGIRNLYLERKNVWPRHSASKRPSMDTESNQTSSMVSLKDTLQNSGISRDITVKPFDKGIVGDSLGISTGNSSYSKSSEHSTDLSSRSWHSPFKPTDSCSMIQSTALSAELPVSRFLPMVNAEYFCSDSNDSTSLRSSTPLLDDDEKTDSRQPRYIGSRLVYSETERSPSIQRDLKDILICGKETHPEGSDIQLPAHRQQLLSFVSSSSHPSRVNVSSASPSVASNRDLEHAFALTRGFSQIDRVKDLLVAILKGHLTRKLFKTDRVQNLIKTIKDTQLVLQDMSNEEKTSRKSALHVDKLLKARIKEEHDSAKQKLHEIFFLMSSAEQVEIIYRSRIADLDKQNHQYFKSRAGKSISNATKRLSAVSQKTMQRRQQSISENHNPRPKTAPESRKSRRNWNTRILKPIQSHASPMQSDRSRLKRNQEASSTKSTLRVTGPIKKHDSVQQQNKDITRMKMAANLGRRTASPTA